MRSNDRLSVSMLHETLLARDRRRRERVRENIEATSLRANRRNDLAPTLQFEERDVGALRPPSRNIRGIDPAHVQEVARSIGALGFSTPVIIDADGTIIDGVVKVEAAKLLGLASVPCIIVAHLTRQEQRLLRLAANRLAEKGAWNLPELKIELEELILDDAPIAITGFDLDEVDQLLLDDAEVLVETGEFAPPAGAAPVARLGDQFALGPHRLLCGDATDPAVIDRLMQDRGPARLILTDQPYNVKIRGHVTGGDHREFPMASGEMSAEAFARFTRAYVEAAVRHLCDGGVFGTFIDWRGLPAVHAATTAAGLEPVNLIVWSKTNAGMGSLYRSQHELLPLARKGTAPIVNTISLGKKGRWRSNVWVYPGASSLGSDARKGLKDHPTVKPTLMLQDALLDLTHRSEVVLDPFLGSGSTLIAAEACGRVCCGVELDPLYVDVICRRYHAVTGKPAIHGGTGLTFDELATQRAANAMEEQQADTPGPPSGPDPSAA